MEDLKEYRVLEDKALNLELKQSGYRLHTLRPPSSGVLLGFMLRILEGEGYCFVLLEILQDGFLLVLYHLL